MTLLTDFGLQDGYVGMMKGAIAQINPTVPVIDLTHLIAPQNIAQARFVLMNAFPHFPAGTVHVAVVDPGVGSRRRGVAIAVGTSLDHPLGFLVGPDNGLFSGVLEHYAVLAVVELNQAQYWRTAQPSHTFHGRDIFAPVAAHLASGVPLAAVGTAIAPNSLVQLPLPPLDRQDNVIVGGIQAVDHFGNLITTIPANEVTNFTWSVVLDSINIPSVSTYSDRPIGTPVTFIGSHGWVEIAIVQGNAQQTLPLNLNDSVTIALTPKVSV
ncbi:MAG: SAM-dependent chlorinase/fluorinase [Leptolyngbyaceae cyanobacterium bins.349]|nr:SAM-dependent chlorinase/fluorinase [Leptolyngbyaceae cyanobacterium bins.349]